MRFEDYAQDIEGWDYKRPNENRADVPEHLRGLLVSTPIYKTGSPTWQAQQKPLQQYPLPLLQTKPLNNDLYNLPKVYGDTTTYYRDGKPYKRINWKGEIQTDFNNEGQSLLQTPALAPALTPAQVQSGSIPASLLSEFTNSPLRFGIKTSSVEGLTRSGKTLFDPYKETFDYKKIMPREVEKPKALLPFTTLNLKILDADKDPFLAELQSRYTKTYNTGLLSQQEKARQLEMGYESDVKNAADEALLQAKEQETAYKGFLERGQQKQAERDSAYTAWRNEEGGRQNTAGYNEGLLGQGLKPFDASFEGEQGIYSGYKGEWERGNTEYNRRQEEARQAEQRRQQEEARQAEQRRQQYKNQAEKETDPNLYGFYNEGLLKEEERNKKKEENKKYNYAATQQVMPQTDQQYKNVLNTLYSAADKTYQAEKRNFETNQASPNRLFDTTSSFSRAQDEWNEFDNAYRRVQQLKQRLTPQQQVEEARKARNDMVSAYVYSELLPDDYRKAFAYARAWGNASLYGGFVV